MDESSYIQAMEDAIDPELVDRLNVQFDRFFEIALAHYGTSVEGEYESEPCWLTASDAASFHLGKLLSAAQREGYHRASGKDTKR